MDKWQKAWSESFGGSEYKNYGTCECGLHKTFGANTNLNHSSWCPLYIEIKNTECRCTPGGWHSVGCVNRKDGQNEET